MLTPTSGSACGFDWFSLVEKLGPTIGTLFIGIVGFGGVILTVWSTARLSREQHEREIEHERKGLAAALMGEIISILLIVNARKYVGELQNAVRHGRENPQDFIAYSFIARRNYFEVFSGSIHRLGLLPESLPEEVSRFYTLCKSILEDAEALQEGTDDKQEDVLTRMQNLVDLMIVVEQFGLYLIDELATVAERPVPEIVGQTLYEKQNGRPGA